MNKLFALILNLNELAQNLAVGKLSMTTYQTAVREELFQLAKIVHEADGQLLRLLEAPELNRGFFECADLAGAVEYCPLCDCSEAKGHAEHCPWAWFENFLEGEEYGN